MVPNPAIGDRCQISLLKVTKFHKHFGQTDKLNKCPHLKGKGSASHNTKRSLTKIFYSLTTRTVLDGQLLVEMYEFALKIDLLTMLLL